MAMHSSKKHHIEAMERRAVIYRLLQERPGIQPRDICAVVNLTGSSVSRHLRAIREGWKPEPEQQ